jgi:predicted GIY-YIG superfamily endonuclease
LKSKLTQNTYTGCTTNIVNRINDHNNGKSKFTSKFKPWYLVWYCAYEDDALAWQFEQYLKTGSGKAFAHKHLM